MTATNSGQNYYGFGASQFNQMAARLMHQRPSLFNYATQPFIDNPELLSRHLRGADETQPSSSPISLEQPLELLSTNGHFGVDFCFQVSHLSLEFHPRPGPSPVTGLEDSAQQSQHLALALQICGAVACPSAQGDNAPPAGFSLDLLATACARWQGPAPRQQLAMVLRDVELADVNPDSLASELECYVTTTLRVGIVPRIRLALDSMLFELGQFATLTLAPVSAQFAKPRQQASQRRSTVASACQL